MLLYDLNPTEPDSDGDGVGDWEELFNYGTNPHKADSDNDGVPDGPEIAAGCTSPMHADTFTKFQLARILGLPPITVSVTSDFSTVYMNPGTIAAVGQITEAGLVAANATNRPSCEPGSSGAYGDTYLQYTALSSAGLVGADSGGITVYMDHYADTPGQAVSDIDIAVGFTGARITDVGDWNVDHDCATNDPVVLMQGVGGDAVTWSCDFGYLAEYTDHTFGGYGWRDIVYEPLLPALQIAPSTAYGCVGGNPISLVATASSNSIAYSNEIWWCVSPQVPGGPYFEGASNKVIFHGSGDSSLHPGSVPGIYEVRAAPNGVTALSGIATVIVYKAAIEEPDGLPVQTISATDTLFRSAAPWCFEWQYVHVSNEVVAYHQSQVIKGHVEPIPPTSYNWTVSAGTISNAATDTPIYVPDNMEIPDKMRTIDLALYPIAGNDTSKITRQIEVYQDHLERDYQNFKENISCQRNWSFTNDNHVVTMPGTWNCFGSVLHAYNGSGTGSVGTNGFSLPAQAFTKTQHTNIENWTAAQWNGVLSTIHRGDVVAYYSVKGLQHANTSLGDSSNMYGANNDPILATTPLLGSDPPANRVSPSYRWYTVSVADYIRDHDSPRNLNPGQEVKPIVQIDVYHKL